jgi:hypothetical protein
MSSWTLEKEGELGILTRGEKGRERIGGLYRRTEEFAAAIRSSARSLSAPNGREKHAASRCS